MNDLPPELLSIILCEAGNIPLTRYVCQHWHDILIGKHSKHIISSLLENDESIQLIEWAFDKGYNASPRIMYSAIFNGRLDVIRSAYEAGYCFKENEVLYAYHTRQIPILIWFISKRNSYKVWAPIWTWLIVVNRVGQGISDTGDNHSKNARIRAAISSSLMETTEASQG